MGPLKEIEEPLPNAANLRKSLKENGYLLIRNLIGYEEIKAARQEVFVRLGEVGELLKPFENGVFSGSSTRDSLYSDRGKFWESVNSGKALRSVTNGKVLTKFMSKIFDEPAKGFDYLFLRAVPVGRFTHLHCDSGFFTRATNRVLTCWIAFTDIAIDRGPLFVVEGSHDFADIRERFTGFDVALDTHKMASIESHPVDFARKRNTRLLTTHFHPGDVLIFGMFTVHGAFEHQGCNDQIRLTCDVRYQPTSEPTDPRYFGLNPGGTTGAGYGELNGARPLTEDWHMR